MGELSDRMVGRRRELDALATWLDAARSGVGRLVLCAGEAGMGKTRLAQELAGLALAGGTSVAWGRCVETEGAPAFWPWRQVLRALDVDPDTVFGGDAESPEDRFRIFDAVARRLVEQGELVIVLDDIHWADEPSQRLLRHLADQLPDSKLLVFAAYRDHVLPDLVRAPGAGRLDLRGFGLDEVRDQLVGGTDAASVLALTGGNPLFVREVARAMADGTWRPDRPPKTVLDVAGARLDRVSADGRELVQAAAIVGRDFELALVAEVIGKPVHDCLPLLDEAMASGLVDHEGGYRFVHALMRDAVEASLSTVDRARLHRKVAEALEPCGGAADIARHWAALAPFGESGRARVWTVKAAEEAVRQQAFEEGVRLYRSALAFGPDDAGMRIAMGRAAYFAGDLRTAVDAASRAAGLARESHDWQLFAEAALTVEAAPGGGVNAVVKPLCEEALEKLQGHQALRARLLALRSHLAFYDGEQHRLDELSAEALRLAREAKDDRALSDALRARQEACPGPRGIEERLQLAEEMLMLRSPRAAMWGQLWRVQALVESGQIIRANELLPALDEAVERAGGPVSAWHRDVNTACVLQAQGRYAEAKERARRAYERMRELEPSPATGAYLALRCALVRHQGADEEDLEYARTWFEPPPRFRLMGRLSRSLMLLCGNQLDEAREMFAHAGPVGEWDLPVFFLLSGRVIGVLVTARLHRHDDLAELLDLLEPFRGAHAAGSGVAYMGPVELALGIGYAALGRTAKAKEDLTTALAQAERAGALAYAAEARERLAELNPTPLSARELEVASLVARGRTNKQIAQELYLSERTAQNHVQHILTKLGFTTRSQIAVWMSTAMSTPADGRTTRSS